MIEYLSIALPVLMLLGRITFQASTVISKLDAICEWKNTVESRLEKLEERKT